MCFLKLFLFFIILCWLIRSLISINKQSFSRYKIVLLSHVTFMFFFFRFDPLKLLQILRGKRLMFVGDSVQRAQFESLVCLVQSIIPQGEKSLKRIPPRKIFTIQVIQSRICLLLLKLYRSTFNS